MDPVKPTDRLSQRDIPDGAGDKFLRHSEKHYRLLFESNPLPVWVYDAKTSPVSRSESIRRAEVWLFARGVSGHDASGYSNPGGAIDFLGSSHEHWQRGPGNDCQCGKHRKRDAPPSTRKSLSVPLTLNGKSSPPGRGHRYHRAQAGRGRNSRGLFGIGSRTPWSL